MKNTLFFVFAFFIFSACSHEMEKDFESESGGDSLVLVTPGNNEEHKEDQKVSNYEEIMNSFATQGTTICIGEMKCVAYFGEKNGMLNLYVRVFDDHSEYWKHVFEIPACDRAFKVWWGGSYLLFESDQASGLELSDECLITHAQILSQESYQNIGIRKNPRGWGFNIDVYKLFANEADFLPGIQEHVFFSLDDSHVQYKIYYNKITSMVSDGVEQLLYQINKNESKYVRFFGNQELQLSTEKDILFARFVKEAEGSQKCVLNGIEIESKKLLWEQEIGCDASLHWSPDNKQVAVVWTGYSVKRYGGKASVVKKLYLAISHFDDISSLEVNEIDSHHIEGEDLDIKWSSNDKLILNNINNTLRERYFRTRQNINENYIMDSFTHRGDLYVISSLEVTRIRDGKEEVLFHIDPNNENYIMDSFTHRGDLYVISSLEVTRIRDGKEEVFFHIDPNNEHADTHRSINEAKIKEYPLGTYLFLSVSLDDTGPKTVGIDIDTQKILFVGKRGGIPKWSPDGKQYAIIGGHYDSSFLTISDFDYNGRQEFYLGFGLSLDYFWRSNDTLVISPKSKDFFDKQNLYDSEEAYNLNLKFFEDLFCDSQQCIYPEGGRYVNGVYEIDLSQNR